jgi:hypothetical protein
MRELGEFVKDVENGIESVRAGVTTLPLGKAAASIPLLLERATAWRALTSALSVCGSSSEEGYITRGNGLKARRSAVRLSEHGREPHPSCGQISPRRPRGPRSNERNGSGRAGLPRRLGREDLGEHAHVHAPETARRSGRRRSRGRGRRADGHRLLRESARRLAARPRGHERRQGRGPHPGGLRQSDPIVRAERVHVDLPEVPLCSRRDSRLRRPGRGRAPAHRKRRLRREHNLDQSPLGERRRRIPGHRRFRQRRDRRCLAAERDAEELRHRDEGRRRCG